MDEHEHMTQDDIDELERKLSALFAEPRTESEIADFAVRELVRVLAHMRARAQQNNVAA
jgi:hypothetical protein